MDEPGRLLTTRYTIAGDERNSPGGATEAVNNSNNSAGGATEAVNNSNNSAGGARQAVNNRINSAGGAREVVCSMRVCAGRAGQQEQQYIRGGTTVYQGLLKLLPKEATWLGKGPERLLKNRSNGIGWDRDAANNKRNSIG